MTLNVVPIPDTDATDERKYIHLRVPRKNIIIRDGYAWVKIDQPIDGFISALLKAYGSPGKMYTIQRTDGDKEGEDGTVQSE